MVRKKKVILNFKKVVFFALASSVIYFANGGIAATGLVQIQSLFFVGVLATSIFLPRARLLLFFSSLLFLFSMVVLYTIGISQNLPTWTHFAQASGSTGFGIILLVVIIYIPELLKKGYIYDFKRLLSKR